MPPSEPSPYRPQFRLATLLLVMFIVSVAAALLGGLLRVATHAEDTPSWVYVLLTVAAPVGIALLLAAANTLRSFAPPPPEIDDDSPDES